MVVLGGESDQPPAHPRRGGSPPARSHTPHALTAKKRAAEDRFGLSPLARRRLQWGVDRGMPTTPDSPEPGDDARWLRVVNDPAWRLSVLWGAKKRGRLGSANPARRGIGSPRRLFVHRGCGITSAWSCVVGGHRRLLRSRVFGVALVARFS
jgi:hypothetical protein